MTTPAHQYRVRVGDAVRFPDRRQAGGGFRRPALRSAHAPERTSRYAGPAASWRLVPDNTGVVAVGSTGPVAEARLQEDDGCLTVDIWLDPGVLPHHLRTDLARGVLAHPSARVGRAIFAAFPCGESELLQGLRSGLTGVQTRVAGSTCLLEGRIR